MKPMASRATYYGSFKQSSKLPLLWLREAHRMNTTILRLHYAFNTAMRRVQSRQKSFQRVEFHLHGLQEQTS